MDETRGRVEVHRPVKMWQLEEFGLTDHSSDDVWHPVRYLWMVSSDCAAVQPNVGAGVDDALISSNAGTVVNVP